MLCRWNLLILISILNIVGNAQEFIDPDIFKFKVEKFPASIVEVNYVESMCECIGNRLIREDWRFSLPDASNKGF
jgi:hypothetical protein